VKAGSHPIITDNNSTACVCGSAVVYFLLTVGCEKKDKLEWEFVQ